MSRNTIQTPREYIIRNMVPSPIDNVLLLTQDIMERANTSWWRGRAQPSSVLVNFLSNDHSQNTESRAHILFTIGSYIKIYVRLSTKLVYLWFIFQILVCFVFRKNKFSNQSSSQYMIDKNIIRLRCEVFKNKYNRKTKKVYTHLENPIKTGIVSPTIPLLTW